MLNCGTGTELKFIHVISKIKMRHEHCYKSLKLQVKIDIRV